MRTLADGTIKILTDLDASGFQKGISKLGSLAKAGLGAVTTGVAAVSAALTAAAGYAVNVGSSFEAAMSEVAAISGAAGDDLEALTAKAKEMGASAKFSATESAEALKYMAMAGWDTEKMLSGLPGVMNLAAASGESLGLVSDIVTDSMTAFGLSADQAAHFSDVLAQASNKSNTNVALMGETFKYVAPVAGALGYSIEDTAVAIGLMANNGIKGSQAGTALRSTLSRLAKPTDEVQAAMDKLGISLTDSEGNMKSLGDIMQDMRSGFQGLTADQQAQYAASIAGQEGMSGLLAIVNTSDEDFAALSDAINNAAGASQRMADTMQDNLQGAVTIAKSALEGLGITVYETFSDSMKETVQTATGYIDELNDAFSSGLDSGVKQVGTVFAKATTDIARQAPKMVKAASSLIKSFVSGLSKNSKQIAKAAVEIGKALISSLSTIIPQAGKVAGEIVSEFARQLFGNNIGDQISSLASTLGDSFQRISLSVVRAVEQIAPVLESLGSKVIPVVEAAIRGLSAIVAYLAENIQLVLPLAAALAAAFAAWSFGPVVASIAACVAGLSTLALTISSTDNSVQELAKSQRDLEESQTEMGESFAKLFSTMGEYSSKVSSATGFLDSLSASYGVTLEKQNELRSEMDSTMSEINAIFSSASQDRRDLTDEEIAKIDELLAKYKELSDSQVENYKIVADAVQTHAQSIADSTSFTAEQFVEEAAEISKTAQDAYDQVTSAAKSAMQDELAVLNQRKAANGGVLENYEELRDGIVDAYNAEIEAAENTQAQTNAILSEGFAARISGAREWADQNREILAEIYAEQQSWSGNLLDLAKNGNGDLELLEAEHNERMAALNQELTESFSASTAEQVSALMDMATSMGLSYDEMDAKTRSVVDSILGSFASMDEPARASINQMLADVNLEIDEGGNLMYISADGASRKVIEGWNKNSSEMVASVQGSTAQMSAELDSFAAKSGLAGSNSALALQTGIQGGSDDVIAAVEDLVGDAGEEVNLLEKWTGEAGANATESLTKNWSDGDQNAISAAQNTGRKMNSALSAEGQSLSNSGGTLSQKMKQGWSSKDGEATGAVRTTVQKMSNTSKASTLTGPTMGVVRGAEAAVSVAINAMQAIANSRSISVSARVSHASGGYWAKGGVTKYARGGVSPEIHKHAAGVFTKRTRLWDPVTGINEYGEAGHEALLPLKQSVYDEIAKGIVRQLSPAKLSGLVAMLKSAVQSRAEAVTVQVVEKRELNAAEKALSPAPDTDGLRAELAALRDKLDRTVDALRNAVPGLEDIASVMAQAFSGLKVVMDSQPVGRLVTPAVNERLNDLYDLEERGRF